MKKIALHWQILIGIVAGILVGFLCIQFAEGKEFVIDWIKPFGTIFINLLKLIAIPLIIVSLIKGVSDLKDTTQLSGLGLRTLGLYLLTTIIAVTLGLGLVNLVQPGGFLSDETREEMLRSFGSVVDEKVEEVTAIEEMRGPLQPLVDIVPENIFESASANSNMLQIIFFSIIVGIAIILLPFSQVEAFKRIMDSGNAIVLKIVDIIMFFSPYGVFALMAALVAEAPSLDVFKALGAYSLTVVAGLLIIVYGVYSLFIYFRGRPGRGVVNVGYCFRIHRRQPGGYRLNLCRGQTTGYVADIRQHYGRRYGCRVDEQIWQSVNYIVVILIGGADITKLETPFLGWA